MADEQPQTSISEPAQAAEPQAAPVVVPDPVAPPITETSEPPQTATETPSGAPQAETAEVSPVQVVESTPVAPTSEVPPPVVETPAPVAPPSQPVQDISTAPQAVITAPAIAGLRHQAQAARTGGIQKKLDKIMELAREKKTIRNDDIEKLLHVSDSTAQRYLGALVKQGKLRRVGNRGSAHYELI
ncbi:MAG: hypothetical protein A2542_02250 [Parcubacteria group bacterium RIFOXYD2_FULL_52_8]|nr:MAG: hypothetical protein A2542_02250 [Parcubacteria group bacterium RIFOXYD2_FULL_52_8]